MPKILPAIPAPRAFPLILVTTKDQETDKVWGERRGAFGYVVKPPVEAELVAMINKALEPPVSR